MGSFGFMRALKRFGRDRRGNFALMTALLAVPVLAGVGLAVDYANLLKIKSRLDNAADAAVLAAIASNSKARQWGDKHGNGRIKVGESDAETFFRANFTTDTFTITKIDPKVWKDSTSYSSTLTYKADVPITFGGVLGVSTMTVAGAARASIGTEPAVDFYMVLDNSPSMGVGATTADIAKMVASTPDQCAFACHSLDTTNNYYTLAKKLGVAMRIDVVRQATQQLTDTAKAVRTYSSQFRMAVYSFGEAATAMGLTEVAKLSDDMGAIKSASGNIDLMTIPYQNYDNDQLTSFDKTLASLNAIIPDPGSGFGDAEPQKVVFFVADGVGDSYKPGTCTKKTTGGRCQEPIDTTVCEAIKARGIKIAVLYTSYLPLPTNAWYMTWINPFQNEIGTRMQSCASPGLFFEVSPSQGISDAMSTLFKKTITTLRIVS